MIVIHVIVVVGLLGSTAEPNPEYNKTLSKSKTNQEYLFTQGHFTQLWLQIVRLGVVLGLGWGTLSVIYFTIVASIYGVGDKKMYPQTQQSDSAFPFHMFGGHAAKENQKRWRAENEKAKAMKKGASDVDETDSKRTKGSCPCCRDTARSRLVIPIIYTVLVVLCLVSMIVVSKVLKKQKVDKYIRSHPLPLM